MRWTRRWTRGPGGGAGSGPGGSKPARSPFGQGAKKALELSLRESLRLKSGEIGVGHLLLGVLRVEDGAGLRVVADHGLDPAAVRRAVEAKLSPSGSARRE
ncbi:Clp protease N-terminal domain-containing protein [Kitasatospora aureofaciens]|uniref:Clp protease N-terminal domain-containing protein n=1 Tax=Kitasatospora aureofaciens TaxID=1894 RepID=UPI0022771C88|nr:Clp protease N-terminal domain-containing protein [Kitasatospora aureofaciens]